MQNLIVEKELDINSLYSNRSDAEKRIFNKLKKVFEKYVQHVNDWDMLDIKYTMFEDIVKIYKYNAFPTIIKDKTYDSLLKNNLYWSAMSFTHHKNFVFDKDYRVGKGNICNGITTTEDNIHINHYAVIFNTDDKNENVMKLKISNTNGVDIDYISKMLKNEDKWINIYKPSQKDVKMFSLLKQFLNSIKDEELREGFKSIFTEENNLAVYLGYDYIAKRNTNEGDLKIILNRGIVLVSESEADRIQTKYNSLNLDA